ncbi:pentapeptide repeat-containing protein [Rhodococcus sp. T2V]|uniref:pentapeptide repeat-containing protein n=1 Tax=Rhodococcus sp. T2V TaxID=3034164 RepID=UPI0023E0A8EF|nr:pentapeptide repeat-containing protein [Rhodococcus sp. T2V]MDF3313061.1 pentapeptide repeat-containing protein [Rhodococcus sp. T2V]
MTKVEWALALAAGVAVLLSLWSLWRTRSGVPKRPPATGLKVWFRISVGSAFVAALALAVLVVAGIFKEWVAQRFSGVMTPLGAVVAASIASAGAARTVIAQNVIARRHRLEDAEKELWSRFDSAAEQLADKSHFAIRVAGVYAFVGLADDWLHHHERRDEVEKSVSSVLNTRAECETIVDTLCAYLRLNTHHVTDAETHKSEKIVNEAIISQFRLHLGTNESTPPEPKVKPPVKGAWSNRGLELDLRGAELFGSLLFNVDLRNAYLARADLYNADLSGARLDGADLQGADLCKADLSGANLTGAILKDAKYDDETQWPSEFDPLTANMEHKQTGGLHRISVTAQVAPAPPP